MEEKTNMRSTMSLVSVVCVLMLSGFSSPALADLTFTLTPSLQQGVPGSSVIFNGTLAYSGAPNLFLNDISVFFNTGGAFLTADTNVFFANVPGVFFDGDSYSGPIFGVDLANNIPPGEYTGTATILGGLTINDFDELASQPFTVRASPEPGTMALYLAGGLFIFFKVRRTKQA
jgi:hypothetical protein